MFRFILCVAASLVFVLTLLGPEVSQVHANHKGRRFIAFLNGNQEVPSVSTRARGVATFGLSKDGKTLSYRIVAVRIDNVTASHIHLAPRGQNGGVAVFLFQSNPPTGNVRGTLVTGSITAADFGMGGQAAMDAMLQEMRKGDAYVNVHTTDHPPGEIRGQIRLQRRSERR